jgi:lipopolysaccharide/colanic/teichoic acid biosynthesis glycosyltransferase
VRVLDVALSGLALSGFAPVLAGASAAILLEDGGPILFRQVRVGRGRRPFVVWKLRTMRDGRVTRVGRYLRATGLDEVPQFVQVLTGAMAIVGPRPLTEDDVVRLGLDVPAQSWRFAIRPGITGLAQLFAGSGRAHSRRLDRLQIARKSLPLDLQIIAASFAVNIAGKTRVRALLRQLRRRRPV